MTLKADTAAALIVGNELLSGKIQEANLVELARVLRVQGVLLKRAMLVPDEVDTIAAELSLLRSSVDVVFTSGGVGPTHDDVTIEAVARSFGVDCVIAPELAELLRAAYGDRCSDVHLRMAKVPRGATLLRSVDVRWPTTVMGNVFVLPGVPEIFRAKLDTVRAHVRGAQPFAARAVYLNVEEAEVTPLLDQVVARHPDVEIGSYPKWSEPRYRTKVTFDARTESAVEAALRDFVAHIDSKLLVGLE